MIRAQQNVRVARIDTVAENIKRFELVSMNDEPLPVFSAGSHIIVTMREGEHVWRNPYSIMGATNENRGYVISVQRSSESRGGSEYMHTKVDIGSHLEISEPVNLFALAHKARKHIFLAGGIGITPMLAMLDFCKKAKASCELHYAVRSDEAGAFCRELADEANHGVHVYRSNRGERIPLAAILGNQPLGTHVYICGPQRMIDWALDVAKHEGWPEENVHYERFSTPPPGKPFEIEVRSTGERIPVGDHQSALEAPRRASGAVALAAFQCDPVFDPGLPAEDARACHQSRLGAPLPSRVEDHSPDLVDYKGITRYHQTTVDWLSQYDDGKPTPQGFLIK